MAKFKFVRQADAAIVFAERWVPEKGTTVDGVEESVDRTGELVGYHTLDPQGHPFAVYSGDYIVEEGNGHRPYAAALFPEKFNGVLPHGRIVPAELFLVVDLLGALLEELIPGSSPLWDNLIESMYVNPFEAKAAFTRFIDHIRAQGMDTGSLETTMTSLRFFDPVHN